MGQVFTWEALGSSRIPKLDSFHVVTKQLRDGLAAEHSIVCAVLVGSVIRGDFNIRSDIDCVVLYETDREEAAMVAMHHLDRAARQLYVPINFVPCDTLLAETRLHHLGSSFVRHLEASIDAGGLIKGNIVGRLAPTTISIHEEVEAYIKMKMYNMQEALAQSASFSEERITSFLKKGLEAPTHVARKMLTYEGRLQGDSKKQVQDQYRETMSLELVALFNELLSLDSWYTRQVERQIRQPDRERYDAILTQIQAAMPKLLQFLRLNILRLNLAIR